MGLMKKKPMRTTLDELGETKLTSVELAGKRVKRKEVKLK